MANDDKVLSQAEIDALLASSLEKGNAPENKASAPAAAPQVKLSAPPPPPSKASATSLKTQQIPIKPAASATAAGSFAAAAVKAAPAMSAPVTAPSPTPPAAPLQNTPQGLAAEQIANICRQVIVQETKDLNKQVMELTIQANTFEKTAQKIAQIEEKLDQIAALVQASPKAVKTLGARIDEIYGLLDEMRRPGRKSDEERIHDQFHCVNCHSEKLVAIHVKCTSCGTENWMGWFPESG